MDVIFADMVAQLVGFQQVDESPKGAPVVLGGYVQVPVGSSHKQWTNFSSETVNFLRCDLGPVGNSVF